MRAIADSEPYPTEALGPLREAAEAAQDCTQCPPAIAAQSALAVAALAAEGLHDVETLHGEAVLSLFLLTVAQSGERKSSTNKLLMKPIAEYQAFLRDRFAEKDQSYKAAFVAWKSTHDEVLKSRQRGDPARSMSS
ncbi:MAG: DUF3987 domain-containing protein [Paracoccaceae bacterium]